MIDFSRNHGVDPGPGPSYQSIQTRGARAGEPPDAVNKARES